MARVRIKPKRWWWPPDWKKAKKVEAVLNWYITTPEFQKNFSARLVEEMLKEFRHG